MKKELIYCIIFIVFLSGNTLFCLGSNSDVIVKNSLFALTIPNELKGVYEVQKEKDRISIFHKDSKKAGFGGFAFGIKAYKNPYEHANLPGGKKIGELLKKSFWNRKGTLYDVVLKYPTDIQYDYAKDSEVPESYKKLYYLGNTVKIEGSKRSAYFKNQGTKGKDLYKETLAKHITAIKEKWDFEKLEKENMSYMYNVLTHSGNNVLEKIGYTYYDVNADGIEELLIGEIADGNWKGVIYDMYTMVDRQPKHVISGGSRNRYFVCDNAFVCNEYSSGALESGLRVYILVENSTELFPQVSFKYDEYMNPQMPWYLSYGSETNYEQWKNVSENVYKERKNVFEQYERFEFTTLKQFETDR